MHVSLPFVGSRRRLGRPRPAYARAPRPAHGVEPVRRQPAGPAPQVGGPGWGSTPFRARMPGPTLGFREERTMRKITMLLGLLALASLAVAVAGCNTSEGFGKDIESGGRAIRDS